MKTSICVRSGEIKATKFILIPTLLTHTGTKTFTGDVYAWLQRFVDKKLGGTPPTVQGDLSSYFKNTPTPSGDDDFKVLV